MSYKDDRQTHQDIEFLGLRAHATAVGFLQLCTELRRAGVLDERAVGRIKEAIGRELAMSRPRTVSKAEFDRNMRRRMDMLFVGGEEVGDTHALAAGVAGTAG